MRERKNHLGYTLIEVLAVVVLLGLIAVSVLPAVVRVSERSQRSLVVSSLLHLDARARLLSAEGQIHVIRSELDRIVLEKVSSTAGPIEVDFVQLPENYEIAMSTDSGVILFNVLGVSPHYSLTLNSDELELEIKYNGVSGWYEVRGFDE